MKDEPCPVTIQRFKDVEWYERFIKEGILDFKDSHYIFYWLRK